VVQGERGKGGETKRNQQGYTFSNLGTTRETRGQKFSECFSKGPPEKSKLLLEPEKKKINRTLQENTGIMGKPSGSDKFRGEIGGEKGGGGKDVILDPAKLSTKFNEGRKGTWASKQSKKREGGSFCVVEIQSHNRS